MFMADSCSNLVFFLNYWLSSSKSCLNSGITESSDSDNKTAPKSLPCLWRSSIKSATCFTTFSKVQPFD